MKLSSVFVTFLSTFAVSALTAVGFSSQAQALTFSGKASGTWGEPIPIPGSINTKPVFGGVGSNSFTWGKPNLEDTVNFGTPPNKLTFTGSSFFAENNSLLKIGDLSYFNGIVEKETNVDAVPFNLRLSLSSPSNEIFNEDFQFQFGLINTDNDANNTPDQNADTVKVSNQSARSFTFAGDEYILDIIGFSQDDGKTTKSEFTVREKENTTAGLFAKIREVPKPEKVPEPGSIVGLSALGIYLIYRNKSKNS